MDNAKKKVLILHGWMHSAQRYSQLKTDLQQKTDAEVTLYEFPGFGDTPAKYYKGILPKYARDLREYLKQHRFDYIIGHSMGGNMMLRAVTGDAVDTTMILLSPEYLGIPVLKWLIIFKPLVPLSLRLMKWKNGLTDLLIKLMSLFTINKWKQIDRQILQDVRRADARVAAELMYELAFDKWKPREVYVSPHRTLLIVGERDRIIQRSHMVRLQGAIANCELRVLPGIGHTAVLENYEALLESIAERINRDQ